MPFKRRYKTVQAKRYKSAGLGFLLVLSFFIVIMGLADNWFGESSALQIEVCGNTITTRSEVQKLAAIPDTFTIDEVNLLQIERNVTKNPFVKSAVVTTLPPRTVLIEIVERTPYAHLLGYNNADWLIDEEGVVMPHLRSYQKHELPVITGEHLSGYKVSNGSKVNNKQIAQALHILRTANNIDPVQYSQVSEVHLRKGRDIILYTTDAAIPVLFGNESRADQKLRALYSFIADNAVNAQWTDLVYVDLRFSGQVVARWSDENIDANAVDPIAATMMKSN